MWPIEQKRAPGGSGFSRNCIVNSSRPLCPRCYAIELRRHPRVGFWQRAVLTRLGYFPWECGQCRGLFLLKQRYAGTTELDEGSEAHATLDRLLF